MPEVIYPSELEIKGPILISSDALSSLDDIFSEALPKVSEAQLQKVPRLVEDLRLLIRRIEMVLAMAPPDGPIKKRRQNPATWFFVAVHDLYCEITADHDPGVAGPLHRFTKHCAALIDARIVVPESENSFQKRLTAALARRTGKISVLPRIIFPGK